MRRLFAALFVVGIFVGMLPSVSALTWSNIEVIATGGAGVGPTQTLALTNDLGIILYQKNPGGASPDVNARSCNLSTNVCTDVTVYTTGAAGYMIDAQKIDSQTIIACTDGGGSDFFQYLKSTTSGGLWSISQVSGAGTVTSSQCGVTSPPGVTNPVWVLGRTAVSTDDRLFKSTDGGTTFTASTPFGKTGLRNAQIVAKNTTDLVAVFDDGSNNLYGCYSTDAGATFTCAAIGGATINGLIDLKYAGGNTFVFVAGFGSSAVTYGLSTDNGITWQTTTPFTPTASSAYDLAVLGEGRYAIVWGQASTTVPAKYLTTTNNGVTWSSSETVYTHGTSQTSTTPRPSIGITPNGVAVIGSAFEQTGPTGELMISKNIVSTVNPPAAHTVTVVGLTGFDASPDGDFVIARTDNGWNVRTFSGTTLAQYKVEGTQCARSDGIIAANVPRVGYLSCDSANNPFSLAIRTPTFGGPPECRQGPTCNFNITITGFEPTDPTTGDPTGEFKQMGQMHAFGITYATDLGNNARAAVWGWTSNIDGKVGVAMYSDSASHTDSARNIVYPYASVTAEKSFCTGFGTDGKVYLGLASENQLTKILPVNFAMQARSDDSRENILTGSFSTAVNFPPGQQNARGIACNQDGVMVYTDGFLYNGDRNGTLNNNFVPLAITSPVARGVALSRVLPDGAARFVVVDGTTWKLGYANNGTICASNSLPTGTFKAVSLTNQAQTLYIATDVRISEIPLGGATGGCVKSFAEQFQPGPTSIPTTGAPGPTGAAHDSTNVLGMFVNLLSDSWGFDTGILFGLVLILGIAVKAGRASNGAPLIIALAALIGTIVTVKLGLVDTWVIYVVVFLIIAVAGGVLFARSRSGEGGET